MQDNPFILGFTAGELSPWLSTRFDLAQYSKGAARIENFLVEPYGGITRRHGTRFVSEIYNSSGTSRFFPFTYSENDYLLLEIFLGGIRFWNMTDWLRNSNGSIYILETPWTSQDILLSLRFIQVNDVIFVTSPHIHPCQIKRVDELDWVYERCPFDPLPKGKNLFEVPYGIHVTLYNRDNKDYVIDFPDNFPLDVHKSGLYDNEHVIINCTADSKDYYTNADFNIYATIIDSLKDRSSFNKGDVIAIRWPDTDQHLFYTVIRPWSLSFAKDHDNLHPSAFPTYFMSGVILLCDDFPLSVAGGWSLQTSNEWDSSFELRRSYGRGDGTFSDDYLLWEWHRVHQFSQTSYSERKNWAFSGFEKKPSRMAVFCLSTMHFSSKSPFYFRIEQMSYDLKLLVVGPYSAPGKSLRVRLVDEMASIPDDFFPIEASFTAFGAMNGFPSFAGVHEGRLWLGGTAAQPTTLRASALDDFYNFKLGSDDTDALELTLSSSRQSRMCWMSTERGLLLGTTDAEWLLTSSDSGGISPTSASFKKQSTVGSENMEAEGVENSIFYVQRGGKRLREISYKLEADGYTSTDTSMLAEHLFTSGIKEWVAQRGSSTRVWVLMNDGTLAVLTTNSSQGVNAWQRVSFKDASVVHVSCLVSATNHDDDVWLIIKRGEKMYIECIQGDEVFLDSHVTVSANNGVISAPHLAGKEVVYYPSNSRDASKKATLDSSGRCTVTGANNGDKYIIGIPLQSTIETFPIENQTSYNTVSQQARVKLRLLNSEARFNYKATHVDQWEVYDPARDHLSFPYTGAIRVTQIPESGVGQGFCLLTESLYPFNLLSLSIENDFHGR